MTREQAIAELKALVSAGAADPERSHSAADGILCDLLVALGYEDVVREWAKVEKWYA